MMGKGLLASAVPTDRAAADMPGDPLVRAHAAAGDAVLGAQHLLLKRGAQVHPGDVQGEADLLSVQERHDSVRDEIHLGARRGDEIGKRRLRVAAGPSPRAGRSGRAGPLACPDGPTRAPPPAHTVFRKDDRMTGLFSVSSCGSLCHQHM